MSANDEEKKIIQNPTSQETLECIRSRGATWRPNPHDPYFYISFSLEQLSEAYLEPFPRTKNILDEFKPFNIAENRIKEYSQILVDEWAKRAGIPIKFLDPTTSKEQLYTKNVIFITGKSSEINPDNSGFTLNFIEDNTSFKIIMLNQSSGNSLSRYQKHVLLHEAGHALIDMKHFSPHASNDKDPFCKLGCQTSVMAYLDDCNREDLLYYFSQKFLRGEPINEMYAQAQAEIAAGNLEPLFKIGSELCIDVLSSADIMASQEFMSEWQKKNKELLKKEKAIEEIQKQMEEIQKQIEELNNLRYQTVFTRVKNFLSDLIDSTCQHIADYSKSVVTECPSYFGPNDVTSIRMQEETMEIRNSLPRIANHHASLFITPAINHTTPVMRLALAPHH